MPQLRGFFDYFPDIDLISIERVFEWLNYRHDHKLLENQYGNRILYPYSVPVSRDDLDLDLALLREELRLQPNKYYEKIFKRINIPEDFLELFPDTRKLVWAFIDALKPVGITTILVKSSHSGIYSLGTAIVPESIPLGCTMKIWLGGKKYEIKEGSLVVIPANKKKMDMKLESEEIKFPEGCSQIREISGGEVGIVIDLRGIHHG